MRYENETRQEYRRRLEAEVLREASQSTGESESGNTGGNGGGTPPHPPYYHNHGGNFHKWLWRLVWIFGALIVLLGGYEYYQIHNAASGIFSMGNGKLDKKLQKGEPVSILAMGTDVGALNRGNTGGNTDTLEMITINPGKKDITLTSIPRDTLVRVNTSEGPDYVKINAAYSIGGPKKTVGQVRELLNVPIDYYAVINMGVLKKVVNAVGGVDVNNPFAFNYEGHHFPKGHQHLNGEYALKYSRMRYDDPNNDYGRQKRQQQILESVIAKFKHSGSVGAANKILAAVKDGIKTNVPIDNVAALYSNYHVAMQNVKTYHLQGENAMIDGASFQIAPPKEINRISRLVRAQLNLPAVKVNNYETRMYNQQSGFNGGSDQDFILPGGASYNTPGSGSGSNVVTSSVSDDSTMALGY